MDVVRTEKTSKWLKGSMALSVLATAAGAAVAFFQWGTPWAQVGGYVAAGGAGGWLLSRLAAWWQYG